MREDSNRFRFSYYQLVVLGLFALSFVFYLAHRDLSQELTVQPKAALMSITPITPTLSFKPKPPEPTIK